MAASTAFEMGMVSAAGDALAFRSMQAFEEVSCPFEFQIIAVSDDATLAADDLLGTTAAVWVAAGDAGPRWFNGVVTAFGFEGMDGRQYKYRLCLRPSLWLLTRSANLRVFQDKSVPDILTQVFSTYTGTVTQELSGTYAARTFCVQYRETDFNFVSRLMEEEGIFYFFRHSEDKHELVIADAASAHVTTAGFETVQYLAAGNAKISQAAINEWQMRHEVQTGKVVLRDYNFLTPDTDLTSAPAAGSRSHAEAALEVYDYPGLYAAKADGDARALIRLEEAQARFGRFTGQGNTQGLAAGARFTLAAHPRDDQNAEYIVLSTRIEMSLSAYESGADESSFGCSFTLQRYDEPFRPARNTRKPAVAGPQTAVVVGEGDAGDIVTDEHGRVKIQFHWDRIGKNKANSSCWVRVASPSAGNGFGMISLPRLGQEVVVDFLEGDPDQPLITGRVYNASQKTPYELPVNATVSTMKSRSKLGGAAEFNELRFEDKKGSEYLLFHAQKDRFEFVEETLKSEIGKDEHRTVKADRKEKIEGEYHLSVVKDLKQKVDGKFSLGVGKDLLLKGGGIFSLKTAKDITAQSGAAISLKSTADLHLKIGTNIGADAGQNVHIKAGMNVVIEAGVQISIKAGASSIVLGPDGVSITGSMVKINSGGSPGAGAGASPVAPTDPDAPDAPELPKDPLTHR
ncbi:type VI secretion system Vgr family protein [Roseateles oligotrophus]|uniref:Type VI secretion system tip protein VgrG n=1 Tax=Roseateles oligotrophus TaxID=1769250 RepID=A0ABT2YG76_9BURK|nr:type VI secretion system tip protein TssI/VgrG [Roseateles oligotrophus]MCV2369029.1 type VI secretion system tip protein VgrG [Roseateles oligotrophus]